MKRIFVSAFTVLTSILIATASFAESGFEDRAESVDDISSEIDKKSKLSIDFFRMHMKIDEELRKKTGKGLMEMPYSIRWENGEAQILYKDPVTGKEEMMRAMSDRCC